MGKPLPVKTLVEMVKDAAFKFDWCDSAQGLIVEHTDIRFRTVAACCSCGCNDWYEEHTWDILDTSPDTIDSDKVKQIIQRINNHCFWGQYWGVRDFLAKLLEYIEKETVAAE